MAAPAYIAGGRQVTYEIDTNRRRFLGAAAMTLAAAQFGKSAQTNDRGPRELAAFSRATQWFNSPHLAAAVLQGKVVLVNFCTYSCINWLRTLPYVRAWAEKYGKQLVVIGVHTPEFPF